MKLKNLNLSLSILVGLMFLSFAFFVVAQEGNSSGNNVFLDSDQDNLTDAEEKTYGTDPYKKDTDGDGYSDGAEVAAGYNPLIPAPGDKITDTVSAASSGTVLGQSTSSDEENLTEKMAQKISVLTTQTGEDQELSMEDIQSMINDALSSSFTDDDLPEIKKEDIKILEQNYKGTEDEITAQKKEDFINYITAVFYILSSNSPKPLTSSSNFSSVISDMVSKITGAISSQDSSALSDLSKSGEKIFSQLKEVSVPEDLVELHIKALRYAQYSEQLEESIDSNPDDPIKSIANLSKIRAFIGSSISFSTEATEKFAQYGVTYDDSVKEKLKSLGIDPPDISDSDLNSILSAISGSTDSETSEE